MRRLLPLLLLSLWALPGRGSDIDRTLQERISKPDYTKAYDANKGSPSVNRSVQSGKARSKEFSTGDFRAKDFSTREFASAKPAYLGKSKVITPDAPVKGRNSIPNMDAKAPTRTMAVKEARDAGKTVDTRASMSSDRPFLVRGRSQDLLDKEKGAPQAMKPLGYVGNLKTLTVEEIRELLNKNK